ncbi:hypothetical protein, partial [Flavobacterium sp.]|uniref:hypothetical protein n=1 Tax=Flavobacterium sp. TaxID=239 RepID=UPI0037BF5E72
TNLDVAGNAVIRNDLHIFGSSSNYGQLFVAGEIDAKAGSIGSTLNDENVLVNMLYSDTLIKRYIFAASTLKEWKSDSFTDIGILTIAQYNDSYWYKISNLSKNYIFNVNVSTLIQQNSTYDINLSLYTYLYSENYNFKTTIAKWTLEGQSKMQIDFVKTSANRNFVYVNYYIEYYNPDTYSFNNFWDNKIMYELDQSDSFENIHFWNFNLTRTSAQLFMDGALKASNIFATNATSTFFWFYEVYIDGNTTSVLQTFLFKDIFYFHKSLSAEEVRVLHKFVQKDPSDNAFIVKGKLRCDTLSVDWIYKDGEPVPLNSTKFYIGSKQQGKVTLQNDGDRRMLSIDTITLNSVNNLINDSGSAGYLHFANNALSSICQVKAISYSELSDRPIIFSGNYADLSNLPTSFNPSTHIHTISNVTGLAEAFVNTSNYAYQLSSNLQDSINNKWKIDSSCNLYYTTGKIGIGTSSFGDGAILNVKGIVTLQDQTVLGNTALTDETTINTLLNDGTLLRRFYVKSGFVRNVLTSTDYYYPNTIQDIDGKIWGRITYNSGSFDIISNGLVSSSANISLYIYLPVALTFPFQNNTEFTCIVAVSESFRILIANGLYNNVTKTRVQVQYIIKIYLDGFLQSQRWNTKLYYELSANELLTAPHHFAFNITETSAKIYMDGNLKASAPISSDGIYNFGISTVQIVSYGQQSHQNFAWKDVWLFNRLLSDSEVRVLYKFLNNSINETLKVYGKIMCDSIDAKVIYKNNEPIIYNKKDLFEGTKELGKITVQNKGTRRSLSIDTIEINSTSNIINNSGSTGYLYYSDANQDTIAQIKVITYNDLAQIPSTFAPSPHTHSVSDISGLSQSFTDTSNYVRAESNVLR